MKKLKVLNYNEFSLKGKGYNVIIKVDEDSITYIYDKPKEKISCYSGNNDNFVFKINKNEIDNYLSSKDNPFFEFCDELLSFNNVYMYFDLFEVLSKNLKKLFNKYDSNKVINGFNRKTTLPPLEENDHYFRNTLDDFNYDMLRLKTYILRLYLENCDCFERDESINNIYIKYAGYLSFILIGYRDMNHSLSAENRYIANKCIKGYKDFEVNLYRKKKDDLKERSDLFNIKEFSKELNNYRILKSLM